MGEEGVEARCPDQSVETTWGGALSVKAGEERREEVGPLLFPGVAWGVEESGGGKMGVFPDGDNGEEGIPGEQEADVEGGGARARPGSTASGASQVPDAASCKEGSSIRRPPFTIWASASQPAGSGCATTVSGLR
jgi:hypothetical protein